MTEQIETVTIHNGRIVKNRVIEVKGIPSGRRRVEVIRGRKWVKVRVSGRKTFKRISREIFEAMEVRK